MKYTGVETEELKELRSRADAGDPDAQYEMGLYYGTCPDTFFADKMSVFWFEKAADSGSSKAMVDLGRFYSTDIQVDPVKSAQWFARAAEKNSADGMYRLADCYQRGFGVEQDKEKALELYRKASIRGSKAADRVLIDMIVEGELGFIPDEKDFKENLEAAKHGRADAMNVVGSCYEYGMGTEKSVLRAIYWYQEAALSGSLEGRFNLQSICALTGCTRGDLEEIQHRNLYTER